jgi:hypothetical protein
VIVHRSDWRGLSNQGACSGWPKHSGNDSKILATADAQAVKTRDAKYQAYVMSNDPAINAQIWLPRN